MRLLAALVRLPVKLTLDIAGRVLEAAAPVAPSPQHRAPPPPPPVRPRPPRNGGAPPLAPEPPAHVDEGVALVAEVADRGAEQGPGAEVHVDPPWPGYDAMTAADIRDRLRAEATAVAAAVILYEASRKGRSSVLEAARRTSARPSG
jgi:hypothetical protein